MGVTRLNSDLFIVVQGVITEEDQVNLFPSFTTREPHSVAYGVESSVEVRFTDSSGSEISRTPLPSGVACGGDTVLDDLMFAGKVVLPVGTRGFDIFLDGKLIAQQPVEQEGPDVDFRWIPGEHVGGIHSVAWEAEREDSRPLYSVVAYTADGGTSWSPLSLVTSEQFVEVNFDELPGGERCAVKVIASNGTATTELISPWFQVARRGCKALILQPLDKSVHEAGGEILLVGQGYWLEERRPEFDALIWVSSESGELAQGNLATVRLPEGEHVITLRAGSADFFGTDNVSVYVGDIVEPTTES